MIPQVWKIRIKLTKNITVITCENFEYVKKPTKKSSLYFYRKFCETTLNQQQNSKKDGKRN